MAESIVQAAEWPYAKATSSIWRHSRWDLMLVSGAVGYALLLLFLPSVLLIGVGLWWCANTVAHNFIHLPFFKRPTVNRTFSAFLSLVMGVPQRLWRDRHMAHHAGVVWQLRWSPQLIFEGTILLGLWSAIAAFAPLFFLKVYLPGLALGLCLCHLQGYFEHAAGTTSHYGKMYNTLFFNDGFHVEHHHKPHVHWTKLPAARDGEAGVSRWPAVFRFLDGLNLDALERAVLKRCWLQNWVVRKHEVPLRKLLSKVPRNARVVIVGGGLFPRTALAVRKILPHAEITIMDQSHENLRIAKEFLGNTVSYDLRRYTARLRMDCDVAVFPLAFEGERSAIYENGPAPVTLVHEWIWKRTESTAIVSILLAKRLNLIVR